MNSFITSGEVLVKQLIGKQGIVFHEEKDLIDSFLRLLGQLETTELHKYCHFSIGTLNTPAMCIDTVISSSEKNIHFQRS